MKKLLVVALALCLLGLVGKVSADEISIPDLITKLPALNQCVIYSVDNKEVQYATTVTLVSLLNEKLHLDLGYTPKQEIIGAVSFKLVELKDYIQFPILKYIIIEPIIYIGFDRVGVTHAQNEMDWGAGVKVLEIKF